jgi:hypothetical protein
MPTTTDESGAPILEALLGDDAEADAFVYSLYADVCSGEVRGERLAALLRTGHCYDDDIADIVRLATYLQPMPTVERILIHLDRQSSPSTFEAYGPRVVPFFNYAQAAFVLLADGRLPPLAVVRVLRDLVLHHHFDGPALARSYVELARRGHVDGRGIAPLVAALDRWLSERPMVGDSELAEVARLLSEEGAELGASPRPEARTIDYERLVTHHNPRRRPRRR